MLYTSARPALLATLLLAPISLAQEFRSYNLFVGSNIANGAIEFDRNRNEVTTHEVGLGARDVAFGPDGNLYISRFNGDRVHVIAPNGNEIRQIGTGTTLDGPWGLAFGPDGNLYVASVNNDRILVFAPNGTLANTIQNAALDSPRYLDFSPDGHLFVSLAGGRILEFDAEQEFQRVFADQLGHSEGLCFAADGKLYATSQTTVLVFDAAGVQLDSFGGSSGLSQPFGLVIAPNGNILVSSFGTNSIFEFEPNGVFVSAIEGGSLNQVHGLAIAPKRAIVKVSGQRANNGALTKISATGTFAFFPGQGTMTMSFADETPFNGAAFLLRGFEVPIGTDGKKQMCYGEQRAVRAAVEGVTSISLLVGGAVVDGFYEIKSAKGTLHSAHGSEVLSAKISVSKPLN